MIHGIDPKIDYAFKRLFAVEHQRGRLIDLLNAVLDPPPDARIADVTILDPFNLKTYEADKLSIVDVKAID